MTQEQIAQAKAYVEALNRAKEIYNKDDVTQRCKGVIEDLFPEIRESEDERIRKEIISLVLKVMSREKDNLNDKNYDKMLDWLEKQKTIDVLDKEEREFADNVDSYRKDMDEFYKKGYNAGREAEKQYWLERQDGQKSDKVGPKFHEGDWAVSNLDGNARRISEVHFDEYNSYYVVDGKSVNLEEYDRLHRLWSIEDTKDGDVLVDVYGNIGIFQKNDDFDWTSYCSLGVNGGFQCFKVEHENDKTHPATKEQRDLLFSKTKEAGYEWDETKKELKKIVIHKWEDGDIVRLKEDDGRRWQITKSNDPNFFDEWFISQIRESGIAGGYVSTYILDTDYEFVNNPINDAQKEIDKESDKLRKTASETTWNKNKEAMYDKPTEWNEEDEDMLKSIIATCELAEQDRDSSPARHLLEMQTDWLKTLKERMKGD